MEHQAFMARCLELAKNGLGTTYPNPLVGSVIVHDGIVIGEGWHRKAGGPHAEVVAVSSVGNKNLPAFSTLYVNLEPCSHFGKTPPCADLIIASGIKRVVVGSRDPNPLVSGNGIRKLQDAGIEVIEGVLENECRELNKRFFTFQHSKRPFVILKWAQSADGFFAPEKHSGPFWISNALSRQVVHRMRSQENAILVGTNTVVTDNPSLNVRNWTGNNPIRFALDRDGKISPESNIFENEGAVIFTERPLDRTESEIIDFSGNVPQQILDSMYKRQIQSVIVEGGAKTLQSFIDSGLWDEAHVFFGAAILGNGLRAPKVKGSVYQQKTIGNDSLIIYKR